MLIKVCVHKLYFDAVLISFSLELLKSMMRGNYLNHISNWFIYSNLFVKFICSAHIHSTLNLLYIISIIPLSAII